MSLGETSETHPKSKFQGQQYHTLHALHSVVALTPHISTNPSQKIYATRIDKRELLWEKILECESGNSHRNFFGKVKCNGQFGCKGGIGICQLIPSTVKECERRMGKDIDPFKKEENLECGRFLFETYGPRRWGGPNTEWGSYHCWGHLEKYY